MGGSSNNISAHRREGVFWGEGAIFFFGYSEGKIGGKRKSSWKLGHLFILAGATSSKGGK